jgi:hypothetical protein
VSLTTAQVWAISCDAVDCGKMWHGTSEETGDQVRRGAHDQGDWRRVGDRDLCPDHAPPAEAKV